MKDKGCLCDQFITYHICITIVKGIFGHSLINILCGQLLLKLNSPDPWGMFVQGDYCQDQVLPTWQLAIKPISYALLELI